MPGINCRIPTVLYSYVKHGDAMHAVQHRRRLLREALSAPDLTPAASPLHVVDLVGSGGAVRMRAPPSDEAVMQWHFKTAHALAVSAADGRSTQPGSSSYHATVDMLVMELVERRPIYWTALWPAGLALADVLLANPALARDQAVLDIGTGLGTGAVCAGLAGAASVLATDVEPRALEYVERNAEENALQGTVSTVEWDFYETPPAGVARAGQFGLLIASDVLYSDGDVAPARVAALARDLVRPGGALLVSDGTDRPYSTSSSEQLHELLCVPGVDGGGGGLFALEVEHACERGVEGGEHATSVKRSVRVLLFRRVGGGADLDSAEKI